MMKCHSHIRSKVTFQRWPAKVSFIFLLEKIALEAAFTTSSEGCKEEGASFKYS